MGYDVVIAGASVAGCTAATLYGRAGLRVALVERNRRPDAYKAMCGHFVLGGTQAMLERCGLWRPMLEAGAVASTVCVRTPRGWINPSGVPPAISLRRAKLDPLLRHLAAETPGVDLLLGHSVTGVVMIGRRLSGLRVRAAHEFEVRGQLVVGADGHRSAVAHHAGVKQKVAPNDRFLFWSYYDDVPSAAGGRSRIWLIDGDVGVAVPTDSGQTLVGAFAHKMRLGAFAGDRHAAIESFMPGSPTVCTWHRHSERQR